MKHTLGEWKAEELLDRWAIRAGGYVIASVYKDANNLSVSEANAKLIAAPPDLLEALRRALDYIAHMGVEGDSEDIYEQGEQAITKATE